MDAVAGGAEHVLIMEHLDFMDMPLIMSGEQQSVLGAPSSLRSVRVRPQDLRLPLYYCRARNVRLARCRALLLLLLRTGAGDATQAGLHHGCLVSAGQLH